MPRKQLYTYPDVTVICSGFKADASDTSGGTA